MKKNLLFTFHGASAVMLLLLLMLSGGQAAAVSLHNPIQEMSLLDSSRVFDLDEVIIVSQPKERLRLRLQPLSSSAYGSTELGRLHATDLRQLSAFVPSFVMPEYGSRTTSSMYVRGIGSRVNSPAVGIYVDNIPIVSKSMFNAHLYETDRIDVMRGPQGTLYGQNTEGGLVRIYSKNPFNYQGTDIRLGLGTGFWRQVEAAHYGKLSDRAALSVAAFYAGQNGFFTNQATDERADEQNEAGAKLRLMFKPTEKLSFDVLADYQFVKQNGFPYGQLADDGSGVPADPATNRQGNYRRNMLTTGLNIGYVANGFELHSTTSFQHLYDNMLMDIDYLPADFMHLTQHQRQNNFSEELVLKSLSKGMWHWTLGAFLSRQWLRTDAPVYFDTEMNSFLSKTIENYAYYGMLNSMAERMGMERAQQTIERAGGCHITMLMEPIPGRFDTPQTNFGLFHESAFELTPKLTATLGLRYDLSHVSIDYETSALMRLDENVMGVNVKAAVSSMLKHQEKDDFSQLLPKVGLTYKIGQRGSNVYATVAKGYRAGGFNIQMFSDILQTELQNTAQTARGDMDLEHDAQAYDNIRHTISYDPEESWNFEVGTHLNLLDNRIQFDFSTYYMQIRNQQLSVMAGNYGFGRMMVNAGKSYSCGLEASLRGSALGNHLAWMLGYGFTHAVFKEYTDSMRVEGRNVAISYKDKHVPFVPMHTLSGSADYRIDFSGALRNVVLGINFSAQGKTYWDEDNSYAQPFYALLGAHADADFGPVVLSLWGRNLTDTKFSTFAISSSATGSTHYFAQRGNPLQVGMDVRIHF